MNDASLRFGDLILRVAQDAGMQAKTAGSADGLPTDPAYLQRLKDAVNDARETVYIAIDPATGQPHNWQCLRQITTFALPSTAGNLNIDGDTSKLWIDPSYQILDRTQWTWRTTDGGYSGRLDLVHPEHVARYHGAQPDSSGHPRLACITPVTYDRDAAHRRGGQMLWVWPKPDADYQIVGLCRRLPHPLVDIGDYEPMGAAHSQTIVAAAMYVMRRSDPDLSRRDWYKRERDEMIARSIAHDKLLTPAVLGEVVDPSIGCGYGDGSLHNFRVTHYGDTAL